MNTTVNSRGWFFRSILVGPIAGALALALMPRLVAADDLTTVGVTQLRAIRSDLTGTGVSVGQVEATTYNNPNDPNGTAPYDPQYDMDDFEVNPAEVFSGSPTPTITYVNKVGTPSTTYNSAQRSGHGIIVGGRFYGTAGGAAPGVTAVVNYNANYFFDNVIQNAQPIQTPLAPAGAPPVSVVNQSFVFGTLNASDTALVNQLYDDYVANKGTIIVTAAGNINGTDHSIQVPASAYNVIAVGDSDGGSDYGPLPDGRSKPDICAPGGATSYSTPYVSGIAAILVQAGSTGSGGSTTATKTAAVDQRTVKALLLNGTTKPTGWSNSSTQPLDPVFGAGIVNAYNSYQNLAAGRKSPLVVNSSTAAANGTSTMNTGWDLNTLTTGTSTDAVAHYLLNVATPSIFTGTLDWEREAGTVTSTNVQITDINHFELMLYNVATGALIESVSSVDNVQYLYDTNLATGVYDLEVIKLAANAVSATDTYGLAFSTVALDPAAIAGNSQGGSAIAEGPPGAVPEPATLCMGGLGLGMLLVRRRGRR